MTVLLRAGLLLKNELVHRALPELSQSESQFSLKITEHACIRKYYKISHGSHWYNNNVIIINFVTQVCVLVEGRYVVEVRLNGYTNPSGKCNSRDCFIQNRQHQFCCAVTPMSAWVGSVVIVTSYTA